MTVFILPNGKHKETRCEMCGLTMLHQEAAGGAWYPIPHKAACNRPCMRGGVPPDYVPGTVHDQNCSLCSAKATP